MFLLRDVLRGMCLALLLAASAFAHVPSDTFRIGTWPQPPSKNRVRGSSESVLVLTGKSALQVLQLHREIAAPPTTTALGRTYTWLGAYGVWDAGHGLYLTRHRAYDANLMRFVQTDPLGLDGGWNLYVYGNDNPFAFMDPLGLCADSYYDGPSWGQGGSQSYSSYNRAVLRSSSEVAAPYYTDALLLGSSLNPATPAGQSMALSQAAGYLTAPGAEMLGSAVIGGVSKLISKATAPAAESMPSTLYHYTSAGNAESIVQNGLGTSGRQVFTTPAGNLSPVQAQIELALPPNRGYPSALLEIDTARLQQLGINPVAGPQRVMSTPTAGGGGVEYIFNQPIPSSAIRQVPFP